MCAISIGKAGRQGMASQADTNRGPKNLSSRLPDRKALAKKSEQPSVPQIGKVGERSFGLFLATIAMIEL
jgi:hypothetical protein